MYFMDLAIENRLLDELERRTRRMETVRTQARQTGAARNLSVMATRFPYAAPGVLQSMAQAGVDPNTPEAEILAAMSGADLAANGGFVDYGEEASPSLFQRFIADPVTAAADFLAPEAVEDAIGATGRGIRRGFNAVVPDIPDAVRAPVRGAATVAEGALQEISRGVTAVAEGGSILTPGGRREVAESYRNQPDSLIRKAGQALARGVDLSSEQGLGTGWLPGGQIVQEQRTEAEQRRVPNTGGPTFARRHPLLGQTAIEAYGGDVSMGRAVASAFGMRAPKVEVTPTVLDNGTLGRRIEVKEAGTFGYDLVSGLFDLAVGLRADPASVVTGTLSKVARAQRTFGGQVDVLPRVRQVLEGAQLVGPRKTTVARDVEDFLVRENSGRDMVSWLAETDSVDQIWRRLGKRVDRDVVVRLADASDEATVRDTISEVLGSRIVEKPTAGPLSRGVAHALGGGSMSAFGTGALLKHKFVDGITRKSGPVRIFNEVPGTEIDVNDLNLAMRQVDDFAKNAKLTAEQAAARIEELARIDDYDPDRVTKVYEVAGRLMADVRDKLVEYGADRGIARNMSKMFDEFATEVRIYFADEMLRPGYFPGAKTVTNVDGTVQVLPTAHSMMELSSLAIPLPDARDIRRHVSVFQKHKALRPLISDTAVHLVARGDQFMSKFWKPLQLFRMAWGVRVIGDEQVRLAVSDYDSAFKHPLSYFAWLTGKRGGLDLLGDPLKQADEFMQSTMGRAGWMDNKLPGSVRTGDFVGARKGDASFTRGWGTELSQLSRDAVAREVSGGFDEVTGSLDDVKEWFWSGQGRRHLESMDVAADGALSASRAAADRYIDSMWARVNIKTGGAADLIDTRTGQKINPMQATEDSLEHAQWVVTRRGDADMIAELSQGMVAGYNTWERVIPSKRLAKRLEKMLGSAPEVVKVPREVKLKGRRGKVLETADYYDEVLNMGFEFFMGKPSNYLSRSPAFKQAYWRDVERLLTHAEQATQDAIFKAARAANLDPDTLSRMGRVVGNSGQVGSRLTSLDDLDLVAKANALDEVKGLLYDLSNRGQFADVTRLIFPFAEAYRELMTVASRLTVENPQTLRRTQQLMTSGWFTTDPTTGEEVFAYPGGHVLTGMVSPGAGRVDLMGQASGLNMVTGTFLPGFGPIVQIPASMLIPERPDLGPHPEGMDILRDLILPYGEEDLSRGVFESQLPAWMTKFLQAAQGDVEQDRLFANTAADVARALRATEEFGAGRPIGPDALQRLNEQAISSARYLYLIRSAAQFVLPTGPQLKFSAETPEGLVDFQSLALAYRRMQEEDFETALPRFIERFGLHNVAVTQAKTRGVRERSLGVPGARWERANPDLVSQFTNVVAFFAPDEPGDEFDYAAYIKALNLGDRETLTPMEQQMIVNNSLGYMALDQAVTQAEAAGLTGLALEAYRRDYKAWLREQYPGFDSTVARSRREPTAVMIEEFKRAVEHPKLRDHPVSQGWRAYMAARDEALAALPEGSSTFTGERAAFLAQFLWDTGRYLSQQHPGFGPVFDRVLSRELRPEDEINPEVSQ